MNSETHLICSIQGDASTNEVQNWFHHFGASFERVNEDDARNAKNDLVISSKKEEWKPDQNYASIWFRKIYGGQSFNTLNEEDVAESIAPARRQQLNNYINKENNTLVHHFYQQFRSERVLSPYSSISLNKLFVLKEAAKLGFEVPDTLVTTKKNRLKTFESQQANGIISKAINQACRIRIQEEPPKNYLQYTSEIDKEWIDNLPEEFGVSLFQEKLDKAYEVRTFYLDGQCYSVAIFSQRNAQTAVDFRRYDKKTPNRKTVYQLPNTVEKRIENLMTELNLNTGSLDFVKTKDGRLVFLEINPAGQYGMTSVPGNYYLDKKIAEYLIGKYEN